MPMVIPSRNADLCSALQFKQVIFRQRPPVDVVEVFCGEFFADAFRQPQNIEICSGAADRDGALAVAFANDGRGDIEIVLAREIAAELDRTQIRRDLKRRVEPARRASVLRALASQRLPLLP